MSAAEAPQWLIGEWERTCRAAGATAENTEIEATGRRLIARWMQPGRHFHNVRHLTDVLARVDELAPETHEPDLVRLAAWYHGAVFDADAIAAGDQRGGEDEAASAELARDELEALGVTAVHAGRVAELVEALRRHAPRPEDEDCNVLCDADLAMLAGDPQRYKTYLSEIRAEYAHLPVEEFVRARIAILRKLVNRESLFHTPLGAAWEGPARQNLQAELHRLEKELAVIDRVKDEAAATAEAAPAGAPEDAPAAPGATLPVERPTGTNPWPRASDRATPPQA
jgi:predicted metal-dependent HD superfamily phosphohydrolase